MGDRNHSQENELTPLDRQLAIPMFFVAFAFLLILGAFLHLTHGEITTPLEISLLVGMAVCYLAIAAETVLHFRAGSRQMKQHIRYLLLPLLRICPRDHVSGQRAWVPMVGWRKTSNHLEEYLTRLFGAPMIVIALLVLPVVVLEFVFVQRMADWPLFKFAIDTSSGFIWMAFVFEFVVMISIVEHKWKYCRRNWIDLAVVLLPLVSYLGAARLGRLVKLKQLSRTAKIYRMRGLAIRGWRAVVALEVIDKLLRRQPEHLAERLQSEILEKERELAQLRSQLSSIQSRIDAAAPTHPPEATAAESRVPE